MPGPGEGGKRCERGGDQTDGDVGEGHVADVHVGRGPQLPVPDDGEEDQEVPHQAAGDDQTVDEEEHDLERGEVSGINHKQQVPSLSRPATVFAPADSPRGRWRGER